MAAVALSTGQGLLQDRSLRWSFAGHGMLLLLVVIGGVSVRHVPPPTQLAIKATVVDPRASRQTRPAPARTRLSNPQPKPTPDPAPKPAAKPEAKPEPRAQPRTQELKAEQLKAQQRQANELKAKELKAKELIAKELIAREALEAKAAAERVKAEAQRREAARLSAARELERQLAEEEELQAASNSGALADYVALIRQKVERNWVRPPGARPGIQCEVLVTQIPGGEVVSVRTERCNADEAVQRSIEAAVLRASPLPLPAQSKLFERNLRFTFKPEQ